MRWAPLLAVVMLVPAARATDVQVHGRVWTGPGFDSNARRDFVSQGVGTQPDGFVFALGQLDAMAVFFDRLRLAGTYDVAARKFFFLGTEDTVLQSAQLESTMAIGRYLALGLSGRVRDRRGAERDYTDLVGGAVLDFFPDAAVEVRVNVSAHRFLFYNRFAYSYWGPDGTLTARYRINRRHALATFGNFMPRTYNDPDARDALENPLSGDPVERRFDPVFAVGLTYSYRGPFQASLGYAYIDQTSNRRGESLSRHRITVTGGVRLPWKVTAVLQATLQLSRNDGVNVGALRLFEDEENGSNATIKFVRPLTTWLDVDLRYAVYVNVMPKNAFRYERHVASLGLAASF